ncbi:MAG: hypothetical protein HQM14_20955 [SAR324 cluster bacterium]|nr:hypothetical protein [SAR324 cluster bacterium]
MEKYDRHKKEQVCPKEVVLSDYNKDAYINFILRSGKIRDEEVLLRSAFDAVKGFELRGWDTLQASMLLCAGKQEFICSDHGQGRVF